MGIFNFWGGKKQKPERTADEGPSPHYVFAHMALKSCALANPVEFLGIVVSPHIKGLVERLLASVAEVCGKPADFTADDIKFHPVRIADIPAVIIEFPEPQEIAQAHLTALVVEFDLSSGTLPPRDQVKARYFTLEKGFTLDDSERTVLGEWTDSSHMNCGDGPLPTVHDFQERLTRIYQGKDQDIPGDSADG